MGWTPDELPDLAGKTYLITGANSGLGLECTKLLASKGAHVVMTARSQEKADGAMAEVRAASPDAVLSFVPLDLADLASVDAAAQQVLGECDQLDAVVNNAGVMQTPPLKTKDGFELQLGTNHLGHFRLNARLYPLLRKSAGRVVPVSSIAHFMGRIDFDDLMHERRYDTTAVYGQSKLANLMYGFELQRRCAAAGSPVVGIPCHPGYSATNLQSAGVGMEGGSTFFRALYSVTNKVFAQKAEYGAWPLALAAADPKAEPGAYYGPTAMRSTRGPVGKSRVTKAARDEAVAKRLWEVSEELVGAFEIT